MRRFQLDPQFKDKIEYFKKQFESFGQYKIGKNVLKPFSIPLNLPWHLVKNTRDLQGVLYSNHISIQKELLFQDFWYNSRQIFQFDSQLIDALVNTDVGDAPWSQIHLPHTNFYISFGEPIGELITLANGWQYRVDGAYVKFVNAEESMIYNETSILIDFTTRLISPDYTTAIEDDSLPGMSFTEPVYSFVLSGEPIDTVNDAIKRGEKNTVTHCDYLDQQNYKHALSLAKEYKVTGMEDFEGHFIKERYYRGKNYILPALNVLFNCIFYITQYPDNIRVRYSDHRAKVLYKSLARSSNKDESAKIKKELDRGDFSRIKVVSDPKITQLYNSIPSGKGIRPHFRKGHWRFQAFGEKNKEHKLIWILPVIVNKDKGKPEQGHLYEVNK